MLSLCCQMMNSYHIPTKSWETMGHDSRYTLLSPDRPIGFLLFCQMLGWSPKQLTANVLAWVNILLTCHRRVNTETGNNPFRRWRWITRKKWRYLNWTAINCWIHLYTELKNPSRDIIDNLCSDIDKCWSWAGSATWAMYHCIMGHVSQWWQYWSPDRDLCSYC